MNERLARSFALPIGLILYSCCALAAADAIWVINSSGKEVRISDLRVGTVADGRIAFEDASGKRGQRDLNQVNRIAMDDEPALADAERAYVERKWPDAADAYEKALAGTRRDWVKAWIAPRLIESAENSRRFPPAVAGYLELVRTNPARAENTVPTAFEEDRKALDEGVVEVNAALTDPQLTAQQRQCLLSFLLDIQRGRHDQAAADLVLDQMLKSGNAGAARAGVRRKLDEISKSLEKEDWKAALALVNTNQSIFVDPRDQAEAMYFTAEATGGSAAESSDAGIWKDVALAYMRVVAHFKDVQGAPFVAASLLKTGAIEERLGDEAGAKRVYEQVASQFGDGPAGAAAKAKLAGLHKK
jgi:hypothetical protein